MGQPLLPQTAIIIQAERRADVTLVSVPSHRTPKENQTVSPLKQVCSLIQVHSSTATHKKTKQCYFFFSSLLWAEPAAICSMIPNPAMPMYIWGCRSDGGSLAGREADSWIYELWEAGDQPVVCHVSPAGPLIGPEA